MTGRAGPTVRRFLERTPAAAALVGEAAEILAANARTAELLGWPPGALDGRDGLALVHPDDRERAVAALAETLHGVGRIRGVEGRFRLARGDGEGWTELEITATNLLDDPAMGGILLTALPVGTAGHRAGWFEAVVQQMSDVVQVLDGDGRILYAGPGMDDLLGRPGRSVVGRLLTDIVAPKDREGLGQWLGEVLAQPGEKSSTAGTVLRPDGEELEVEVRATNLLRDPLVRGVVLVTRDVTDQQQAAANARLAARLVDASPLVVMANDVDGRITSWNPAAERFLGWTADEAIGRTFLELGAHTADSLATLYESLEVLQGGGTVHAEAEVTRRDGATVPGAFSISSLFDETGAPAGMMCLVLDLSERYDAERSLARAEGRWSALARRTRELVAIVDEDGTTTYAGGGFATLLGHDPETLVGTSIRELLHADDRGRPGGLDDLAAGRLPGFRRDYRVRHADGSWRVVEVEAVDQRADPYLKGFVLVARDVTERVAAEEAVRHLADAIESTGAAVVTLGLDRRIVAWNRGAEQVLGWPAAEAIGSVPPVVPVEDDAIPAVERGESRRFDATALRPDGTWRDLLINGSPVRDPSGAIVATTWIAFDVTDQRVAEHERAAMSAQQSVIAAVTGRALGGAAIDDVIDEATRLASATLRASVQADLHDTPGPGPAEPGRAACAIEGRDGPIGTLAATALDGRAFGEGDLAFLRALANVLGTVVDRGRVSDEMRRRALHDDLTGLPNRALLVDRLEQAVQRGDRRRECLGVLFVDLDRFKRVNDTLGHAAGDDLLRETAHRLVGAVRAGDTVARVGGDEFVILCEDVADESEARALAGRVVAAIARPVVVSGVEVVVTASVGFVVSDEGTGAESLVRDADLAMYRAKQLGRARVEAFDAAMRDEVRSRLGVEQSLRQAVAEDRLTVVYQPQVDLLDGTVVGLEALVRWDDPAVGPMETPALVGVADEIGLLDEISWFVLEDACATVAMVRAASPGRQVAVSVNLGARQLAAATLVERIGAALDHAGVPPEALVIEVTETDIADESARGVLTAVRELGVRVSLDDFGTGWSSLHRLTDLPVDEVKLDGSFLKGVGVDPGSDAVVRAMAALTGELGLRLVAEGVERADQRDRLLELGCRIGQGWFLGEPVPPTAL